LAKIKAWIDEHDAGASLIPFSGAFELKVIEMDEAAKADFLKEAGVPSALDKVISLILSLKLWINYFIF
jgi:obg-like ATPase 1